MHFSKRSNDGITGYDSTLFIAGHCRRRVGGTVFFYQHFR